MNQGELTLLSDACQIAPVMGNGQHISMALQSHTEYMSHTLQRILAESKLSYQNDKRFWAALRQLIPIVHWEPCERAPGGVAIYLLCLSLPNYDLSSFFSEMVVRYLIPGKQSTLLSTKHLTFRFLETPNDSFFISEIFVLIEDERAFLDVQNNMQSLAQEICLGAVSAHHARHILMTKTQNTQEDKTRQIHKTIIELSSRKFRPIGPAVFFEMHHFLLASDDEFKRIRNVRHMCRAICYHNWFRTLILRAVSSQKRQVFVKPIRTTLHFPFGVKHVLGICIAISHLNEYEQFEARHIASACQRVLPNVTVVPRSFICYQHPSTPAHSFYLEVEKRDDSPISIAEVAALRKGLLKEIPHSIEQLTHTLFMPQNEEEVMRNILLLNQEIRYVRDKPQMIITFQGQSDGTLRFHVTLLRLIKDPSTPSLEVLFTKASDLVEFISGSRKVMGYIRGKYPKEANTFLLECRKKPFLRLDHSVDLPRAREFIAATLVHVFGEVRDFNGGLMSQQNQLLVSIKELLHGSVKNEELHLENLFHSLEPVMMRSLLAPEQIKLLFELFLILHNEKPTSSAPRFRELSQNATLCV
ncbi:MAG: hypothetical protein JSR46_05680, partial [Verrucomicrobia bacterium]|nr:hypothetical protein [Verrucomicrobiota bacterium]